MLRRLLVEAEVFLVMVMVMTAMVYYHHNLRLRRIRYCEAEDQHEAEQNLFHDSVWRGRICITELL